MVECKLLQGQKKNLTEKLLFLFMYPLGQFFFDLNGFTLTLQTHFPLLSGLVPGHVLSLS